MTGCLGVIVPDACQPFADEFFKRLRVLDEVEDSLSALGEFEKRYGTSSGATLLRAELKSKAGRIEIELKDRLGGIAECTRREAGDIELEFR